MRHKMSNPKRRETRWAFLKSAGAFTTGLYLALQPAALAAKPTKAGKERPVLFSGTKTVTYPDKKHADAFRWPLYGPEEEEAIVALLRYPNYGLIARFEKECHSAIIARAKHQNGLSRRPMIRFPNRLLAPALLLAVVLALAHAVAAATSPPPTLQAKDLSVGVENSLTKVFADEPFTGRISDALELSAAKNEYEAGQVVLVTGINGIEKVSLEFSDLVHESQQAKIPRDNCRFNFVAYTAPTRITTKDVLANRKMTEDQSKRYPDPLLVDETYALKPNSVQPVWVTVYVPAQAATGDYSGEIAIKAGETPLAKVRLKLHIWDFALPESTPLYVWYYNDFNSFANNWLEVNPSKWDAYKAAFRYYVREIARHRGSIGLPLRYDAPGFDEIMQIMVEEGLEFWWVTWLWGKDYVDADLETQKRMAKQVYDAMKQKGLLDSTFFVTWDEPDLRPEMEQNRAKWKQHISVLKDLDFPKRQVEMTWRCQTATALMEPYPTVWCPQYSYFDRLYYDFLQRRHQAGDIIGFYLTGSGNGQEPRHYLPFSLTEMRRLYYYLWRHGLTLCEFWAMDITWRKKGADPFSMVVGSGYGGETDALIYPNLKKDLTKPFLSSLRLEAIRDGIEDYCYLWVLDKLIARARAQGANDLAETGAEVLADLSGKFGKNLRDYHLTNPADYIEARRVLAETIVKLKGTGPDVSLPRRKIGLPKHSQGIP